MTTERQTTQGRHDAASLVSAAKGAAIRPNVTANPGDATPLAGRGYRATIGSPRARRRISRRLPLIFNLKAAQPLGFYFESCRLPLTSNLKAAQPLGFYARYPNHECLRYGIVAGGVGVAVGEVL